MSVNFYDKTNNELKLIAGGVLYADVPVGTIQAYGSNTIPSGWLLCNGQAVSRTLYAELFSVIGTTFGSGNGTDTFNVPDLRESVPKGTGLTSKSNTHLDSNGLALGEFIDDRIKTHSVGDKATGITAKHAHTHIVTKQGTQVGVGAGSIYIKVPDTTGDSGAASTSTVTITDPKHNHTYTGGATTEVKSVGVNYIIKAKQIGVPADIENNINAAIKDLNTYTQRYVNVVRAFITETQTISLTSTFTGLLKVYAHKTGSGNTIRLKINGREIDQFSCFSTDSSGTDLPWITTGSGVDVVLSAYVKKGDSILIDSDQSVTPSTNSWYVYSYIIQYNPSAQ